MNANKDPKPVPKAQATNTLGIDGLSTHPSASSKRTNTELPIEFGRYRLLKVLGEGGMGAVYLAHDIELDRKVALKLPHFVGGKSKDQSERFRREARLAATLDHANICRIHDIGEQDGRLFLTMQYIEGKTLNDIIKAKGAIEPRTAVSLVKRIASAVQVAHAQGIIHRDLKPANIMIKKDRDFVIMDFGLARRVEQEEVQLTATGAVLGTPAYMAPEQLRGENNAVGPQSDVYSLGIILYELLTGQRPFQGTLPQIYAQVLNADSVSPSTLKPGMDAELDSICQQATAASVKQRYRTAEKFAKALGGYLAGQSQTASDALASVPAMASINAPIVSYQPKIQKPKSALTTYRIPVAIGAMVGLAVLVFVGAFLFRRSNTRTIDEPIAKTEATLPLATPQAPTVTPNTSAPTTTNSSAIIASTTELPNAASAQVEASSTSVTAVQNNAQPPGLLWSSPPSKIWWRCASYSPKGNFVAASAEDKENPKTEFATIRVWPIRDDQTGSDSLLLRHPSPNTCVIGMSFSPDGRRLASATLNGSIALWDMDTTTPSLLATFERFDDVVCGVAFSPDGHYFAAGARKAGSPVIVWDISNPREPKESFQYMPPNPNETCSLVFSKDSRMLYVGAGAKGIDGNLFAWQFTKSKEASLLWKTPPSDVHFWIRSLSLSEDGTRMAAIHGIKGYAIESTTGKQIGMFSGHEKAVIGVQWLGNSDHCISASYDRTIRVWNALDGKEIWRNDAYSGNNEGVSVSQDSRYAVSSSKDQLNDAGNVVQFWRLPETTDMPIGNKKNAVPENGSASTLPSDVEQNGIDETQRDVIDGVLQTVDPATRTLTLTVTASQGTKKFKLEVSKEAGDISTLVAGDKLKVLCDPKFVTLRKFIKVKLPSDTDGIDALQGDWTASEIDRYGDAKYTPDQIKAEMRRYTFNGAEWKWTMMYDGKPFETKGAVRIDSRGGTIDLLEVTSNGDLITYVGIYKCTPAKLSICIRRKWFADKSSDEQRPKRMVSESTKPQSEHFEFVKATASPFTATQRNSAPLLSEISETPDGLANSVPAISKDGLTLFWAGLQKGDSSRSIWTAKRKTTEHLFGDFQKLFPGNEPTISSDGRYLVFVDPVKGSGLWQSAKLSADESFKRPSPIAEFDGEPLYAPLMTNNDLVLYAQRQASEKGKHEIVRASRPKRGAPWTELQVVPIDTSLDIYLGSVSNDEKLLFGFSRPDYQGKSKNDLFVLTRTGSKLGFEKPTSLNIPDLPVTSTFPRYSEVNRELLFSSYAQGKGARLWLVRNFDPAVTSPQNDSHDWVFYDAFHHGIGLDDVISFGRDGTLISQAKKPYFIASSQEFSEFVFSVEFMFPQAQVQGNPYISIASTLPNPAGKTWDQQIPLGIELKLNPRTSGPNGLGEVIVPRADFKATVASSQTIKDRRVSPTATAKLNIPAWNTLEIVADAKQNVTFSINGMVVNALANVETTKGHIVFSPPPGEMRLRNAKVNSAGQEKPLPFQNIESDNSQ